MSRRIAWIIPCFDEERRIDAPAFLHLARSRADLGVVFVDDGSRDGTAAVLETIRAAEPSRVSVVRLPTNRGKAEAVRQGLRAAIAAGAGLVGYADADLSTPVEELLRLVAEMESRPVDVLLASRVLLLGTAIERHAHRHYLGRVFATFASLALRLPVYDTQCGAKLFRVSRALETALERPFRSRWIFDVELIGRLLDGGDSAAPIPRAGFRELPLQTWRDVRGSKLGPMAMLRAGAEVVALFVARRIAKARARRAQPLLAPVGDRNAPFGEDETPSAPARRAGQAGNE